MKTKKILVEVVAATMIVAPLAQPARVFNVHALDTTPVVQTTTESPVLQNAEVIIPSNATVDQVTEILNKALIKNLDNVDTSSIEWEYQCEGKSTFASKNTEWGSINGFESTKKTLFGATTTTYTHPSLAANSDGSYQVRIKGNNNVVTVTKFAKLKSVIEVNQGVEVTLPYDEDANVNYAALKENIFNSVVKSSNPELTVNDVNIQYYASATSNVSLGLYLDLPARFTDNEVVIKALDPVVEKVFGKSFTQMMQDGVTVGELRKLFSTQELLDLLEKLHIDTGTFGQILKVINKLPGIADNVRVGFGTPNRPGLYAVSAVTDNKNYETGVGIGALLVKQHVKGVKLIWNQKLTKISKEEAQNFDFKATVTYNGEAVSDENVHYLYTGVQSNLKPYSSTTKAPTEPGVYTMTAVTVGGNYQAAPIIRTFTITK